MSTELATYNGHTPAVVEPQPEPISQSTTDLMAWAESAAAANSVAEGLARTCFVPKAFQGKPDDVTAAILAGNEMGLSPMAALNAFHVIGGKPGMYAVALRGLLQGRGHDIWTEESTDVRAIVCGRRRGSEQTERVVWTAERAVKAGFPAKNPNYKTQPQSMLLARATAECARLVAADALLGMPYSAEELADEADADAAPNTPRKVSRRKKPEPAAPAEPEVTEPTADEATESEPSDAPTEDQPADGALWPDTAQPGSGTPTD